MARDLAASGYTAEQVSAVIHAQVASKPQVHIDVYDRRLNAPTDIELHAHAATVEFDSQRRICGSLSLLFEPVPELLRVPFQYVLAPQVGFGPMPDGGTAWFDYGRYLWTSPKRAIAAIGADDNTELWTVTCGDLNHLLGMNGPGRTGFAAGQDTLIREALVRMLRRNQETDATGIEVSDDRLTEQLAWNIKTGPLGIRRRTPAQYAMALKVWRNQVAYLEKIRRQVEAAQAKKPWLKFDVASDPPKPGRIVVRDLENPDLRWLDVSEVLCELLGFTPPHRDMSGRFRAFTAPDASLAAVDIHYLTDAASIIIPEIDVDPDLTGLATDVYVVAKEAALVNPGTVLGEAHLDQLAPSHPLAPRNSGVVIEDEVYPSSAMSQQAATNLARRELYSSLLGWETITLETGLNPAHEGFEVIGLQVEGDAELDTEQAFLEQSWTADLVNGRMRHQLARTFQAVE